MNLPPGAWQTLLGAWAEFAIEWAEAMSRLHERPSVDDAEQLHLTLARATAQLSAIAREEGHPWQT